MKRQFMIATLAAAAIGVAGCGNEETAGKDIGYGIGALQSTTTTKVADERLEGIRVAIDDLDGQLPDATVKQLESIDATLEDDLDSAENHPEALAAASTKAYGAIENLSGDGSVESFRKAVTKGYNSALSGGPAN